MHELIKKLKNSKFSTKLWIMAGIAIILFVVIYLVFAFTSLIPAGENLTRADWLQFIGTYLSFAAATVVAIVSVFQSKYHNDMENERRKKERFESIQPIFVVRFVEMNGVLPGTNDYDNMEANYFPKHKNVKIEIENIGEYAAFHVILFEKYMWPALKPGEVKSFYVIYDDSYDMKWVKFVQGEKLASIIVLQEADTPRNDYWFPEAMNINYDDIDGHSSFYIYDLKVFNGKHYYGMKSREQVL